MVAEEAKLSLTEFARAERRKDCTVCALPEPIREQIRKNRGKKIGRDTILRWLAEEHGIRLDVEAMMAHSNGHHDVQ